MEHSKLTFKVGYKFGISVIETLASAIVTRDVESAAACSEQQSD